MLDHPMVLGTKVAGANGRADLVATIPANLAGRTYAISAVEVASWVCACLTEGPGAGIDDGRMLCRMRRRMQRLLRNAVLGVGGPG